MKAKKLEVGKHYYFGNCKKKFKCVKLNTSADGRQSDFVDYKKVEYRFDNDDMHIDKSQLNLGVVSHNCICCQKKIKKFDGLPKDKDWEGMWDGGIVERISAGFGSLLDGNMYILAICDDCVKLKKLKCVGNYMFPDSFG